MNATRAAWPEYRTESPVYGEERPTPFRPDLRVVRPAGIPAGHASPAVPVPGPVSGSTSAPAPLARVPLARVPLARVPLVPVRHMAAAPPSSKAGPLRLTRRGRIVVAVMAALLVAGLSLAVAGAAQATGHSASSRVGSPNLTRVVVRSGQTLWSVAQSADPNADPRQIIQQIAQLNALTSQTLAVGQQLWVPRS